jgi:hypothetical protein
MRALRIAGSPIRERIDELLPLVFLMVVEAQGECPQQRSLVGINFIDQNLEPTHGSHWALLHC